MALLLSDEELAAIRPAHVSMETMRWWCRIRAIIRASGGGMLACLFAAIVGPPALAGALICFAVLVLAALAWTVLVLLFVLRFSLQKLMTVVLVTAALVAFAVALPTGWNVLPLFALAIWIPAMVLTVMDESPEGTAWLFGADRHPDGTGQRPERKTSESWRC